MRSYQVTEFPDLVTWCRTVAPLQKWKVSVTAESSLGETKNAGVSLMASPGQEAIAPSAV